MRTGARSIARLFTRVSRAFSAPFAAMPTVPAGGFSGGGGRPVRLRFVARKSRFERS